MATFIATTNGPWSTSLGGTPVSGDFVHLLGYTVTQDIATIPAGGGSLALLDATSGQLLIPLNTLGSCSVSASTMTSGSTATGLIKVTGTTTNTMTINGNITGGTSSGGTGLYWYAPGATLNFNGNITGGSAGGEAPGLYINAFATLGHINIVGNVTGGTAVIAYGIDNSNGSNVAIRQTGTLKGGSGALGARLEGGSYTLTGNLDFTAAFMPWGGNGGGTVTWTPRAQDYITLSTNYVGLPPAAADVQAGAAQFQSGGSLVSGTYPTTAATTAAVQATVVDPSWVVTGHDNYTGGAHGSYPTSATSYASGYAAGEIDQLAADVAVVTANAPWIQNGLNIVLGSTSITGTLPVATKVDISQLTTQVRGLSGIQSTLQQLVNAVGRLPR